MFNFSLFAIILILCIPGSWLMSNHSVQALSAKPENKDISARTLWIVLFIQTFLLCAAFAAVGAYLGPKVGLADPFLQAMLEGQFASEAFVDQLLWGIGGGIICCLAWIGCYYVFIRPKLDSETVRVSETMRVQIGLWTRITSGGIVEEVIFRWGLLALAMWGMSFITTSVPTGFWVSTLVTGTIFGLVHIPGNIEAGCKPSKLFVCTALLGNMWVSVFCGYLFWKHGIMAAFIVHMLFHILWHPLDVKMVKASRR